jgi:serine/threonine-protein kinase RsbW
MPEPPKSPGPADLHLAPACDLAEVRRTARAARRFLAEKGCSETELMDCELALVEACNNAIKFAGPGGRHQPVAVDIHCDAKEIELRIIDHTPGFDWPEQVALPGPESENGRGLYLIRAVMDRANYFRNLQGNTLVLRKKRAGTR